MTPLSRWREERAVFLLTVQFLTRLPVRDPDLWSPARMARIPAWFPAVGVLTGAVMAAVWLGAGALWPPVLAALLAVAAGLLLTGAFHEDGFADACDGLGGGATRERALEIMRDSRLGTYGAAGLGLMLAGRVVALAAMPPVAGAVALVAGQATSRASAVLAIATGRYARDHGTAKPVQEGVTPADLGLALGTAAAVAALALWALPPGALLAGLGGMVLGHLAMRAYYERRLGGYTGDCLGAVQQCSEVGFLLGVLAWL
ncbi:adenosylcobinamide-GDP ribazoletransferase [Rhodobaculum claviforme]|uniref:Adenosylcobinamide-GDP ribazoletransferase n=1 Tax=Rhodobaculum claviforme TaxID=1549854 RepID=A0A934TME3_9RHOB|nr:adenosylcobinamide-GDP ribazoletransferase [Rhodobaculum claviforme]MBK5927837.1 adenosylcobinamide-GDP ribazoletransferase [Rhodobaculum claviforme]